MFTFKGIGLFLAGMTVGLLSLLLGLQQHLLPTHLAFTVQYGYWIAGGAGIIAFVLLLCAEAASEVAPVDIWALQRRLMHVSDQRLPGRPLLTSGSLMYLALMCEELGELTRGVVAALRHSPPATPTDSQIRHELVHIATELDRTSISIRTRLKSRLDIEVRLDSESAQEILDGATDLAVVTAGFSEATGLPGRAGYLEVQRSNASKVNPATGKIDKDPSGKWIKGPKYFTPDLGAVLEAQSRGELL